MEQTNLLWYADYWPYYHTPLWWLSEWVYPTINIVILIILIFWLIIILDNHKKNELTWKYERETWAQKKKIKQCIIYTLSIFCIQILLNLGIYYLQHHNLQILF